MKLHTVSSVLILFLLFASCQKTASRGKSEIETDIRAVLQEQLRNWNEGDIEKFMAGYYRSDSLRFASGGDVYLGWEPTLERYKERYPDEAAMGTLTFADIAITVVSEDAALVFGQWKLQREEDEPRGLFTLLFRRTDLGWRIVHDHTSSGTN